HRAQGQPLLAAFRAAPQRVLEAVEQPIEPERPYVSRVPRQPVHPLVGRAERAGRAAAFEVVAEGLVGPALRSVQDRLGKLRLIVPELVARRVAQGAAGAYEGHDRLLSRTVNAAT